MTWNEYFLNMLGPVAMRSKDPNTKVGAIIVSPENNIVATGYNSFPRGINDHYPERLERPEKYKWMEHAERNAVYAAARIGTPLKGCRMYISIMPCMDCARAIVQTGIVEVVYDYKKYAAYENNPTWMEDFARVRALFEEAGVYCHGVMPA